MLIQQHQGQRATTRFVRSLFTGLHSARLCDVTGEDGAAADGVTLTHEATHPRSLFPFPQLRDDTT
jgi:hypothetical protein